MKKWIACMCLLSLTLGLLAGCGTASAPETIPETAPETTVETTVETTAAPETTGAPAEEHVTVRLGAMTGPTGMGMVKLFETADETPDSGYTYAIKGAADELTPLLLQGELDIVSVPANLASVLYNKTQGKVTALAVNVLGVLYIGEYGGETVKTVEDLKGKTLYATGKGATPEYFLRYVLQENGLDGDKDLDIQWKSEPSEVVATLNAQGQGIAMLPQPYVTAAGAQLGEGFHVALSISEEWEKLGGGSLCTTACILARTEFVEAHPQAVEAFLKDFEESVTWVNENPDQAGDLCGTFSIVKAPIAKKAIPQCNLVCITGAEMKAALGGCLEVLLGQNPAAVGGALPGDDFYYGA